MPSSTVGMVPSECSVVRIGRRPAGFSVRRLTSISPHWVSSRVRGIGVAVMISTSVRSPLAPEGQALVDAEAVLLVDHRQRQVAVFDRVLEQRMGADDDLDGAVLDAAQQAGALLALDRAGQQRDRQRAQVGQGAVVLLGQHLGRRHQGGLLAGLHRAQHRQQRDQGLAGADIALQQPQHAARRGEVGVDLLQRLLPATGVGGKPKRCRATSRSREIADQRLAGAGAHPAADQRLGDLAGEQFVVGQAGAHAACRARRSAGACTARSASSNGGHFSRFSSAGSCHSGRSRQQVQRLGQAGGDLARPQPGGQRPDRLDDRDPVRLVDRHQMVGMGDRQPAVEDVQLAGHQQPARRAASAFPG